MKLRKLGEIFQITSGGTPSRANNAYYENGTIPGVKTGDLKTKYITSELELITPIGLQNSSAKIFPAKTVLVAMYGATIGNCSILDFEASTNQACAAFLPTTQVNEVYLYYFLKSIQGQLVSLGQGGGQPNISATLLKAVKIPLPDCYGDQIRIATLLSRVETLIATRKDNLRLADEFLKSTFLEIFGDPVRNEKNWDKKNIKDFAEVRIGPFGSLLHAEDYVSNGIPLINPSHIVDGKITPNTDLTLSEEKYRQLNSYHLKKNDVVVARRGEIGRCAIVTSYQELFCGTGSMFIRIQNNYPPTLLHFQIYKTSLRSYLESKAKGVTMKNLNSKVLGDLEVLNPPLDLQTQFAAIIEKTERLKTHYQQNLSELETLYAALSQKAFKGELDLSRIPLASPNLDAVTAEST